MRLDTRDDDLARRRGQERRVGHAREPCLRDDVLRVAGQLRHGRPEPGRVLLGRADRHPEQLRRLREPDGAGEHGLAVVDHGHQPLLEVDEQQHGTRGGEQHA